MDRHTSSMNPVGLLRHRELIAQLTRREVSQRYKGSLLGMAWPLIQPLLMLSVYTLIFSVVFRARWPGVGGEDTASFALVIFTGLITFSIFSETVSAAPGLILANRNLVKRSVFPLEILPIVKASSALIQGLFSLLVLLAGMLVLGVKPSWTALCLPAVWLPLWLFALGAAYFLSAMGVFLRDLGQIVGVVVTALFFGSAIFYPLSQVPEAGRRFLEWVPTAVFVEDARQLLLYGTVPFGFESALMAAVATLFAFAGYGFFMKSKKAFADVL